MSIAQGASRYAITEICGRQMYFAAFARNQADAGRASALLRYVNGWKGMMIFARGKIIPNGYWTISQVIECFLEACSCRDHKAHCQRIIDDPSAEVSHNLSMSITVRLGGPPAIKQEIHIDQYAFPCNLLFSEFRFQKNHPSSLQDQIQAAGVARGCDICPYFNPDDFKVVGKRTVLRDVFE
jgi:hypothetical protein